MRTSAFISVTLTLLNCGILPSAKAQETQDAQANAQVTQTSANQTQGPGMTSDPRDPTIELRRIRERRAEIQTRSALFRRAPLAGLHERIDRAENRFSEATDIKFGTAFNTLLQGLSESLPGQDNFGMATGMTFIGTWELFNKGESNQGELTFGLDGRWDYGTTGPTDLGNLGLGSLGFTANQFAAYTPAFLVRNLYWRQGSREAGWMYRIGRITPDAMLSTSTHINGLTTFLPIAGTGSFAIGLPDSGLGWVGGWFINDRLTLAALISDANADRFDFGDLDEGDFYTAVELQAKIFPITPNAGYSKVTLWHNDGTKFWDAINGSTGNEGWGVFVKHEQELTCDGRAIAILRWGKSYNNSAIYEQLAGASFVLYDPLHTGKYNNDLFSADLFGAAYNWVQPTAVAARDESNVEFFYRFPLFPNADMTLSYQAIINPSLDPNNDFGSAFSLRIRSTF